MHLRKIRSEIVFLPDKGLQQTFKIGETVKDMGRRQSATGNLNPEIYFLMNNFNILTE